MKCPQCNNENLFGPDQYGDFMCLDCGYVFDMDEIDIVSEMVNLFIDLPSDYDTWKKIIEEPYG